ncbi:hypothetical protein [Actinopolymorpha singaporensis]|uniref:Uncharacterized protein n=1 Tax=Actinopolymorpha singaporensis TaxID=117157 RepID=A0A1H1U4A1_9ACTN|nr:hypothetical protein [Actinopolymorpha singaporensis]SDS67076.1 hypothetical protein SAMN04489717_3453 [Actinopolymorpha singaporensis]
MTRTHLLLIEVPEILHLLLRPALGVRHEVRTHHGAMSWAKRCARRSPRATFSFTGSPEDPDPLTRLDQTGRETWNLLTTTQAGRYVQLSSPRTFCSYDPELDR